MILDGLTNWPFKIMDEVYDIQDWMSSHPLSLDFELVFGSCFELPNYSTNSSSIQ
jgi:hypothetical protein